jgi:serine/threonine protein kinase HipA of HipAB toxin-antitoxin module
VKRPRRTRPEPPNEEKLRDFLERIEDFERNIKKEIDDIVAIVPKDERERKREEMEMKEESGRCTWRRSSRRR